MELELGIVMMIGLAFVSILGYKAFKSYNSIEFQKNTINTQYESAALILKNRIGDLENSNKNYIYKIKKLRENYEMDYDDVEVGEEGEEEFKISDLATSIYPKLPPSLAKLIDKEEFQNAIIKTIEKKPDILNTFLDKFIGKGSDQKGSNTNSTPKLVETYL